MNSSGYTVASYELETSRDLFGINFPIVFSLILFHRCIKSTYSEHLQNFHRSWKSWSRFEMGKSSCEECKCGNVLKYWILFSFRFSHLSGFIIIILIQILVIYFLLKGNFNDLGCILCPLADDFVRLEFVELGQSN